MRLRHRTGLVTIVLGALAQLAAGPTFWHVSTQADLLKGDLENLSIDQAGRLMLGPQMELVHESTAPFIWALRPAPDDAVWLGTGNDGKVYRIDRDGTASLIFEAPELEVHALTTASDGSLYVGTSPDGMIYRVAADGTSTTFFDPEDTYIWSLVVDPAGDVYVATGSDGTIYKVSPGGDGEPFYQTKATHAVSLAIDPGGNLLASTESPGRIFRIDPDGQGFILLESDFPELRALTLDADGIIYAAAVRDAAGDTPAALEPSAPPATPAASIPSVSAEITRITIADVSVSAAVQPRRGGGAEKNGRARGAVYRILPDGVWDVIWESSTDAPYDLMLDGGGAVIVGTGPDGKIYRLTGDPTAATLLGRAAAQHVTTFLQREDGRRYYATANPGKVFAMTDGLATEGTYVSEVRDAETVATWGTIQWRAATPDASAIQLFTRSGNIRTPDETWSAWSDPYRDSDGELITNPKARYLQWKALLTRGRESPILTSVTTAYLPRNLRPVVTTVTVHPPGTVFQKPFTSGEFEIAGYDAGATNGTPDIRVEAAASAQNASPGLGRRAYRKGLQTIVWTAEDGNEDRLRFDVLYRPEDSTDWKILKEEVWDPIFVWDTTSVPDGTYLVAIRASDAPSNSPDLALSGERESDVLDIDNTPPRIEIGAVRQGPEGAMLPFTVRDAQSAIERVEYSLDASLWRPVYPRDGIADSPTEQFQIPLPDDTVPPSVIVRATDVMNNTSTTVAGPAGGIR